jgi:hypothetical protein
MSKTQHPPLIVRPPVEGFDRAGMREMVRACGLAKTVHSMVRAPFGHSLESLRTLEAVVEAADLGLASGEAMHAAVLEDVAATGSLAIPDLTGDQSLFVGAFVIIVLTDALVPELAALAPTPEVESDLEAEGIDALLEAPAREVIERVCKMSGAYLSVQAERKGPSTDSQQARSQWVVQTLHAFWIQMRGAVGRLTHLGRLRPFGEALAKREVHVGSLRYNGFHARHQAAPESDLKPVQVGDIVGNEDYIEAGLKLARDVAAFDFERHESPKKINPVLFGLGRPGCGKTITAHAIGNYFLEYCKARDIPAKFKVIRRTDWASSYQNASAAQLVKIFEEEVYGFDGVCGVYWPDIDTAFASRDSGDLRMEEKNNLGAVFGIFDGTLIPKDGKWFMMCDANFMQMDEATRSRIAQNPFTVTGPSTPEAYVTLMRDVLLRDVQGYISADDASWIEVGQACVDGDLSGRNCESIANNIRAHVQDFEYPDEYFAASFEEREAIIERCSKRVDVDEMKRRVEDFVSFSREAEAKAATDRFDREVETMVRQLNAGRAATERAAKTLEAQLAGDAIPD